MLPWSTSLAWKKAGEPLAGMMGFEAQLLVAYLIPQAQLQQEFDCR